MGGKEIEPAGLGQRGSKNASVFVSTDTYFEGILDGKNNTIANLNIKEEDMYGVGLIGVLEESGEIKNINIYNGNITSRGEAGGIVGFIKGGELHDSYNKGEVTGGDYQGGVVGENQLANSISNSYYNKPEGSTLAGVGVTRNEGDTNGTTGVADHIFNSLQEFLNHYNISTTD